MGICIAYQGKLSNPELVAELIADLRSKANAAGWRCKTMEELVAEGRVTCPGLQGITLYPHRECEPVHFHVDPEGAFVNHFYMALLSDEKKASMMIEALKESMVLTRTLTSRGETEETRRPRAARSSDAPSEAARAGDPNEAPGTAFFKEGARYNWTKTQFAGPKTHAAVCEILRYVKERYAPDLQITDDTKFFESGDYTELEANFAYVDRTLELTAKAFEAAAAASKGPTTLGELLDRVNEELADAKNKLH
jgi:hypothetical protein